MHDAAALDEQLSSAPSDYESNYAEVTETDGDFWTSDEEAMDRHLKAREIALHIGNRHVETEVDMGEAIDVAFPVDMDYDIADERHMFDDGLSDDESSDSDASTNYEELTEPDIITRLLKVPGMDDTNQSDLDVADASDDTYEEDSESKSVEITPSTTEQGSANSIHNVVSTSAPEDAVPTLKTLDELQKACVIQKTREKRRDRKLWKLKDLQETLRQIELEMPILEANLDEAEEEVKAGENEIEANLKASGLTTDLFEEYKAFCESLNPEHGLRDGFSITCDQAHDGSYVQYDPNFDIFKDCVEIEYSTCNWRCEATVSSGHCWGPATEHIVTFFPLRCPEPTSSGETTWGELYVSYFIPLYHLFPVNKHVHRML